jgi:hypothetical protein
MSPNRLPHLAKMPVGMKIDSNNDYIELDSADIRRIKKANYGKWYLSPK